MALVGFLRCSSFQSSLTSSSSSSLSSSSSSSLSLSSSTAILIIMRLKNRRLAADPTLPMPRRASPPKQSYDWPRMSDATKQNITVCLFHRICLLCLPVLGQEAHTSQLLPTGGYMHGLSPTDSVLYHYKYEGCHGLMNITLPAWERPGLYRA